jgi:peptidoglycan/xylan/chitin deacetylase (PgdA/CDA1 family)
MEIGNHTWSHFDLNRLEGAAWLSDADRGAAPLEQFLQARGETLAWFRYPFLHAGDTPEKKRTGEEGIEVRGWRNAPVTLDNDEWVYAAAYTRALTAGDTAGMTRVADAYVAYMDRTFEYFEQVALDLFQRPVAQVLLVHASPLNRDHLHRVLDRLEARGYRFARLGTVLEDRAYASPDGYVGPDGTSWLLRWASTRGVGTPPMPRAEAWIARFRPDS